MKDPLYLGAGTSFHSQYIIAYWLNLAEVTVLGGVGVFFLILYGRMEQKKKTAYFGLLCITWAIRSLFYNQYIFISWFPEFSWLATIRIEYITLYFALIWAMLFIHRLFPFESHQSIKYALVGINILYIVFVLASPTLLFTRFISIYLATVGLVLLYCVVVVVKAWINERIGVNFLVISILFGVGLFGYDLLSYEGYFSYHPGVFSIGYLVVFLVMAPTLLQHLEIMKSKASHTGQLSYKDLYGESNLKGTNP